PCYDGDRRGNRYYGDLDSRRNTLDPCLEHRATGGDPGNRTGAVYPGDARVTGRPLHRPSRERMTACVESHRRRRATLALGNPETAVELDLHRRYHRTHGHSGTGNSFARRGDDCRDSLFERHHRPRAVHTRHRRVIDAPGRRPGDEGAVIVLEGRGEL